MKLLAAATTLVLALSTPAIAETVTTASNGSPFNPCDYFSYLYTEDGQCVDLSYMNGPPEPFIVFQFRTVLQNLGVPMYKKACRNEEDGILYGYYQLATNQMVLCTNNTGDNTPKMIETLTHESWHTVQDCLAGIRNAESVALFEDQSANPFVKELQDFNTMLNIASLLDVDDAVSLLSLYPEEQLLTEAEARFMQDKPDLVLQSLKICSQF